MRSSRRPPDALAGSRITPGRVVTVSFLVDLLDIASNLIVALLTGSAVVFAEMAQGVADSVGSLLLVIGHRRSRLPGTRHHPLGFSRETFFWSLLSSLLMLVPGAGVALWRGWVQLERQAPLEHPLLALSVLGLSVCTNGYAWSQSTRVLRREGVPFRRAFAETGRHAMKAAFLRDALGTLSAVLGLLALAAYQLERIIVLDAVGAMVIGLLMAGFSVVLVGQARGFIAGRAVSRSHVARIQSAILSVPGVEAINHLSAVHAGDGRISVYADLDLEEGLTTTRIEGMLDRISEAIDAAIPEPHTLRVDLNSPPAESRGSPGPSR
ncbi:MAG TPA: cation diffusion facilitator family transporter [Gemmatimonadota bacterium]|nr:cation diffusion facilitator family transporter [Gemmatimonadota bacterium]